MDKRLQALIEINAEALDELAREIPFVTVIHDVIKGQFSMFVRDVRDLDRIEGEPVMQQLDTGWRVSKTYCGVEFYTTARPQEIAGFNGIQEVAANETD